jgi:hypothetical protein
METLEFISPRKTVQTLNGTNGNGQQTVFDFSITEEERVAIFGYDIAEAEYKEFLSHDSRYADLWKLFRRRNDMARADEYKAKITSETRRSRLGYTDLILR